MIDGDEMANTQQEAERSAVLSQPGRYPIRSPSHGIPTGLGWVRSTFIIRPSIHSSGVHYSVLYTIDPTQSQSQSPVIKDLPRTKLNADQPCRTPSPHDWRPYRHSLSRISTTNSCKQKNGHIPVYPSMTFQSSPPSMTARLLGRPFRMVSCRVPLPTLHSMICVH